MSTLRHCCFFFFLQSDHGTFCVLLVFAQSVQFSASVWKRKKKADLPLDPFHCLSSHRGALCSCMLHMHRQFALRRFSIKIPHITTCTIVFKIYNKNIRNNKNLSPLCNILNSHIHAKEVCHMYVMQIWTLNMHQYEKQYAHQSQRRRGI